jgi:hypothetical protein
MPLNVESVDLAGISRENRSRSARKAFSARLSDSELEGEVDLLDGWSVDEGVVPRKRRDCCGGCCGGESHSDREAAVACCDRLPERCSMDSLCAKRVEREEDEDEEASAFRDALLLVGPVPIGVVATLANEELLDPHPDLSDSC